MSKPATILSVFLASPDDVTKERESIEPIIRELNYTLGAFLGIRLELISWETHSYPGVASDPQAVINNEVPTDYDIFIGILATRFGTPTGRAGSGTEQEFQRAYARYKEHPDQMRIMIYFNDAAPDKLGKIDPEQLKQVNVFRERLGEKGILYRPYIGCDEFRTLVRIHLMRQMLEWNKSWGSVKNQDKVASNAVMRLEKQKFGAYNLNEIDKGYLELEEIATAHFISIYESSVRIAAVTEQLTKDLQAMTIKVTDANKGATESKARIQIANQAAEPYELYAVRMKPEVALFSVEFEQGISAYTKAIILWPQSLSAEQGKTNMAIVAKLKENFLRLVVAVNQSRESVAIAPPLTARLIRASREVNSMLDDYLSKIQEATAMISVLPKSK